MLNRKMHSSQHQLVILDRKLYHYQYHHFPACTISALKVPIKSSNIDTGCNDDDKPIIAIHTRRNNVNVLNSLICTFCMQDATELAPWLGDKTPYRPANNERVEDNKPQ